MNENQGKEEKTEFKEDILEDAQVNDKETEQAPEQTAEEENQEEAPKEAAAEQVDPMDQLKKDLEAQMALVEEWKNKYLYLSAEFDNYRKRTIKEKAELILNGGEKTITAILPVMDDLERVLKNVKPDQPQEVVVEGVNLIHDKFLKILSQQGVKAIETEGQDLNTDYHEAIAVIPAGEDKKNKIIDTVETGYTLNDKVIRHSKVVVGN